MKRRKKQAATYDISQFDDPYTGIAAMILFQALDDLITLDGALVVKKMGAQINRGEVLSFRQSTWALELVQYFGYDIDLLRDIVKGALA